ncbi:ATP-binding protein [Streptomyces sp. NPDC006259]|uniref:ATP-binding protein n=1 Tax=Streptomyces sp. NPDC006259 TaxID=3364740 RepID=UPI0036A7E835
MVIPLRHQAAVEQGTDAYATLRYDAIWDGGAARAADARRAVRAFLARAPRTGGKAVPTGLALDAEIAATELVTNALRHAPGPHGMTLRLSGDGLTVTVRDSSPEKPVAEKADPRRVGGHGLRMVDAVSDRVVVAPLATGKQITAHLPLKPNLNAGTRAASV